MNKSYYNKESISPIDAGKEEPTYNYMLSPYGVEYGVSVGQIARTEDLNDRIYQRMFPDVALKPNFDPRPVSTKYSLLPIVDSYARTTEPYKPYLDYHPEVMFNPGNAKAPVDGYFKKVDLESDLRNQRYLLEKYDLGNFVSEASLLTRNPPGVEDSRRKSSTSFNKYIPSLESDMYKVTVKSSDNGAALHAHPLLFSPFLVGGSQDAEAAIPQTVGIDNFHNHTRTQLRAST